MTADIKSDNAPVSITERYAQLGRGLRESRIADGRVTAGDGVGQPVGADAYMTLFDIIQAWKIEIDSLELSVRALANQ